MLAPDDLDRDELVELARQALASGAIPPSAIVDASSDCARRLGAVWRKASETAIVDCQAVKRRYEIHGADDCYRALFEISKKSTMAADRLHRVYERAYRRYERRMRVWRAERASNGR